MVGYRAVAEKLVEIYDNSWEDNPRMKEVCICGVEIVLSNVVNIVIIVLLATIFSIQKEVLIFFLTFGSLRIFAGGGHAKNHIQCISIYISMMFASIFLAGCLAIADDIYIYIICSLGVIASIIINVRYAATQKELEKELQVFLRRQAFRVMGLVYSTLIILMLWMQSQEKLVIRQCVKEIILVQIFALIAQSIFLYKGRYECV